MDSHVEYPAWNRWCLTGRSDLKPADLIESASIDELEIANCQLTSSTSLLSRFYNVQRISIVDSRFEGKLRLYKFRKLITLEVTGSLSELDFQRMRRIQHLTIRKEALNREIQLHIAHLDAHDSSFELADLVGRGESSRRASFVNSVIMGNKPLGDRGLSSLTLENCTSPDWGCLTKLRYVHVLKIRSGVDFPFSILPHIRGLRVLSLPASCRGRSIPNLDVAIVYGKRMRH